MADPAEGRGGQHEPSNRKFLKKNNFQRKIRHQGLKFYLSPPTPCKTRDVENSMWTGPIWNSPLGLAHWSRP
jgi:hypothetical protein